ncbi:Pls/PosA family non-ribosomal peptide synthetase [Geodermatophilus sp. SYSU D00815]
MDLRPATRTGPPSSAPASPDTAAPAVLVGDLGPAGVRWAPGQRLEQVFEATCDRRPDAVAVDDGELRLTYAQLDARANRLAHHLRRLGVGKGARVGLLCADPVATYTALLGALKAGAAYVPLDPAFPPDRCTFIVEDAGVDLVLTTAGGRDRLDGAGVRLLDLDAAAAALTAEDPGRPARDPAAPDDELCYAVYTSGTTGRPKGVAVAHSSICHFVRVAAEVYGVRPDDRVYQGLTIAFDFSVEEIWVAWAVGAALVPRPRGAQLLGAELHEFLARRRVTALCCVPTLLATVPDDLPDLRFLLVSGEACPPDLVTRWHRPDRRFLNVYGPTETTVTATWAVLSPDRPVTLGRPLPGYAVAVLDPDTGTALPAGALGELGIAGVGLARGYLNRPDLTAKAFVPDGLGLPANPSGRVYRTGDLVRVVDGEVEYHGRIDLQVKVRGYRIELTEVESVLLQVPGVAQAVVAPHEGPAGTELVAYVSRRPGTGPLDTAAAYAHLRSRLPAYMVPAYLEELPVIPMTTSDKADRAALPPPRGPRSLAVDTPYAAPGTPLEEKLAAIVAGVLGVDRVSVTAHLFDDLAANSLLLAHVCARVRERPELPAVSIKDVYQHPTVRDLATAVTGRAAVGAEPAAVAARPVGRAARYRHVVCGAAQALLFLAYSWLAAVVAVTGHEWITTADGVLDSYWRAAFFGAGTFAGMCLLPVLAKWLLVGRWRAGDRFPVWGPRYLRLWLVKTLMRSNPLALFHGSPLSALHLRLMGARVGRGALLLTNHVPVCTDLLTIGEGAVIRKESHLYGYRVVDGMVELGPVHVGAGAVVGEMTVLDVHTAIGDGAELAHASALHPGQSIPAGERWVGSPAEPAGAALPPVPGARGGTPRRLVYGTLQVLTAMFLWTPLLFGALGLLLPEYDQLGRVGLTEPDFYALHVAEASMLFWGAAVGGLVLVVALPRALRRALAPDRVFRLYGWRWSAQRTVFRFTNLPFYTGLFGDSSAIPHWLRALGWDLGRLEQTGSNFGMSVTHEVPTLCRVGRGTMASDNISMMNAEFSATSFRLRRTEVGEHSYLGNALGIPPAARTGANVLYATKVHVPVEGPVRQDVGLLGSPPFEIPRSVDRDREDPRFADPAVRRAALAAKNRHNAVTALLFLLVRWAYFVSTTLIAVVSFDHHGRHGVLVVFLGLVGVVVFSTAYFTAVDRCFRPRRPMTCSIYDREFWRHERYWKVAGMVFVQMYTGTPIKPLVWRALRVRIGKRVFDDGAWLTERNLVEIGDDVTLNQDTTLQSHSLEDGVFKSDHVVVGAGATLGVGAYVHYGTTIGDGAVLAADSFLMKGEAVGAGQHWAGNPARPAAGGPPAPPPAPLPAAAGGAAEALLAELQAAELQAAGRPALPADPGVRVALVELATCRPRLAELSALLSAEERATAEAFSSPHRREQWVTGRALLRLLLSAEDPSRAPADWAIGRSATDRPVVADGPEVSLAHTDGVVAAAVARDRAVGIDVEHLAAGAPDPVLDSALTDEERAALRAAPPAERPQLFLRMWTLKEAVLKCTGEGLAAGPERVATSLDPVGAAGPVVEAGFAGAPDCWQQTWTRSGRPYILSLVTGRRATGT